MRPILALILLSLPASAQDLRFDIAPSLQCLEAAPDTNAAKMCIGEAAGTCMEVNQAFHTYSMSFCLDSELAYWDGVLNDSYQKLRAALEVSDKSLLDHLPKQAVSLRDMQRAWIAYRDQRCSFEAALMQGGTASSTAYLACAMQLTGEQALFLQGLSESSW
ncbi:MAG: lysozyme inhibitor LprI family protein [Roseinatronobacter sp.]